MRADGHLADLVEQKRPAIGELEAAHAPLHRAGERPFFVPEDFAFHERFRNGRAVDGHERSRFSRTQLVQRPGHQLFPRAALARDQHRGARRRDLRHERHHLLHLLRLSDQTAENARLA